MKKHVKYRIKYRIKYLRDSRKKGASMGIVICVAALLIAFSLVMIHTGSMMMATANRRMQQERCYQLAKSFSENMEKQILTKDTSFQKFALQFMKDSAYKEYDSADPKGTSYTYQMEAPLDASYGQVSIMLYKESTDMDEDPTAQKDLEIPATGSSYTNVIEQKENTAFCRYTISVTVTAVFDEITYHYVTEYDYKERMGLRFLHNGNPISWDKTNGEWKAGEDASAGKYDGSTIDASNPVKYSYNVNKITESFFERTVPNGEETGGTTS